MRTNIAALAVWVFGATCAFAQEAAPPLSFQATLDSIRISAQPSQVVTRQFKVTLDSNQRTTHFKARVEDWWRSEDGTQSYYVEPGTLNRSCADWVSLNPVEASVQPGETLTIRLTVKVPEEVASGGFWCALTVDEVPNPLDQAREGVGVRFIASVSTGIFVSLAPLEPKAAISSLSVRRHAVEVGVRNDGNTPVGVEGRIEFLSATAADPVATVQLLRRTVLTEPTRDAQLSARLPSAKVLPPGRYRVRAILDYGADHYIGAEREIDVNSEDLADDIPPR